MTGSRDTAIVLLEMHESFGESKDVTFLERLREELVGRPEKPKVECSFEDVDDFGGTGVRVRETPSMSRPGTFIKLAHVTKDPNVLLVRTGFAIPGEKKSSDVTVAASLQGKPLTLISESSIKKNQKASFF